MPFTTATPFPFDITPMANIGPLTYSDGKTFLREQEAIKNYINTILVPEFNAGITNAIFEYQQGITNAETTITNISASWDTAWQAFKDNITVEIAVLNDTAVASLITNATSAARVALNAVIDGRSVSDAELAAALNAYTTTAGLTTLLAAKIDTTAKGAVNGVAALGSDGKVPATQLPTPAPGSLTGLYSARPAATTVPAGTVYYASNVQETYRSTGAVWAVVGTGGNELGYAEISGGSMTSTESTTGVDVPGLVISFTAGERPVGIILETQLANFDGAKLSYAEILVDGVVRRTFPQIGGASDQWGTVHGETRVGGLTPGQTYVVSVRVRTQAPATSAARFSSEAFLQVVNR